MGMIERLKKIIKTYDKVAHFAIMMVIAQLCLVMTIPTVCVMAGVIAVGKELYDCIKPQPTGFSLQDLLADFCGFCLGLAIYLLILQIL